jgi:prephenate dehydrogenase
MTQPLIKKLAVIGVGLIGGSLALALKKAGAVREVVGIGRGRANLDTALALGIADSVTDDAAAGVEGADLVFLATPVRTMLQVTETILPHLKAGAVVTDAGSVKAAVVRQMEPLFPPHIHLVPGHPIAGTEKSGAAAAFATLFRDRNCILTPTARTDPQALALVTKLWELAGSRVVLMEVERHDRVLAAVSHLPHMVAYALVNAVSSCERFQKNILDFSAGGFRDFTRIASSDPVMWRDIALTNRESLLEMIACFEAFFAELRQDIAAGDGERLQEFFARSKASRDALVNPKEVP